jgi:MoaA/NifB/PqqE/SkfB family radical SAM enzyme
MMYDYTDIRTVHLEITEKCNAACPMCARNINGGEDNPWLQNSEL